MLFKSDILDNMLVECDHCGKEFEKPTKQVNQARKRGEKMYCSRDCRSKSRRVRCFCANCGKEIWKTNSELTRSKHGNVFCDKSCACSFNNSNFRRGEYNPNWRGGRVGSNTYLINARRNYRQRCAICGNDDPDMLEVHHIDYDRNNNNIDNLIILCANHHAKLHRGGLVITKEIKDNRELMKKEE